MAALYTYSLRNLLARRLTTALTAGGMAMVVFVFSAMLMLSAGVEKTLQETGSPDNAVLLRQGSKAEMESMVERSTSAIALSLPEVALAQDGTPLAASEVVVLVNLRKRDTGSPANVVVRGVGAHSLALRPQVQLVTGRMPRAGRPEVIVGASIARRFASTGLGESIRMGGRDWDVVGVFDAGQTGFSSEIWGDAEQLMAAFRRSVYSVVIASMKTEASFDPFAARVSDDPRLHLDVKRETRFYAEQAEMMAKFLRILGIALPGLFSLGAVLGGMITMHAAVAGRIREIGTLRALGFQQRDILFAFVVESLLLGGIGGALGVGLASLLHSVSISTVNFQTFSELAFSFALTPAIGCGGVSFGLAMGLVGGVLPAFRAARQDIVAALRAT